MISTVKEKSIKLDFPKEQEAKARNRFVQGHRQTMNLTDVFHPLDLTVNGPAKQFLKNKIEEWYTQWSMCPYDHMRNSEYIVKNGC